MTITIHVPMPLRADCEGAAELILTASTVGDALAQLQRNQPVLYRSVCDETGAVRRHVNLFLNSSLVCGREGLATAVAPGDVIAIMPAVSGG